MPVMIGLAPSWGFIVAANVLLGVNQGLAWSMTSAAAASALTDQPSTSTRCTSVARPTGVSRALG
jgi:predicted MFS family arabinose efflux permease